MSEHGEYSGFGELNALGNPKMLTVEAYDGGSPGNGVLGQTLPTGIVAEGINIDTAPKLYADPKVRSGMSTQKNMSTVRTMGSKR
jgi:hypothetical protein